MRNPLKIFIIFAFFTSCNPTTLEFRFIYNDEGPNEEIARNMEQLLENEFNVDIRLIKGSGTNSNLDSLVQKKADMALVENYVNRIDGVNSAFAIYSEVLHIFFKKEIGSPSFFDLVQNHIVYIGREDSPSYNVMMDLFTFYNIPSERVDLTFNMAQADVIVVLTNLLTQEELRGFRDFSIFSFDDIETFGNGSYVEGISLRYPRLEPFIIPAGTYWGFSPRPIVTLSLDLIMMVRSGLGYPAVNDLVRTMLQNKQVFAPIDPLLYAGLSENFDRSKLNIPLHEGARAYLDRDEPGFFERYAELAGVVLSITIAITSGLISLIKWQAQKKKDKIDIFYEELLAVKNAVPNFKQVKEVVQKIKEIQLSQNKAFEMLISEELVANDSFRIYMDLSRETINDLKTKLRVLSLARQK